MSDAKSEFRIPDILGILPLRGSALFPHAVMPLAAGRASSVRLLEDAVQSGRLIGAVMQRDPAEDAPTLEGLHRVGTVTTIHKVLKQPDGTVRLVVQGLARFRIVELLQTAPFLRARVEAIEEPEGGAADLESQALVRSASALFRKVVSLSPTLPDELAGVAENTEAGPGVLADLMAAALPALPLPLKQELLETLNVKERLQKLVTALSKEVEVLELGSKIQSEVHSEMSKSQREYYLREQLKAIQKELGDGDERTREIDELRERIEAAGMSEEGHKEAIRELDRLAKMPPAAAEYTVARTYIDWLVAMPWKDEPAPPVDLAAARAILDEDHEGAREDQGPHPRVPRGEEDPARGQGPDPLLRGPARGRQDIAGPLHRPGHGPQVPSYFLGRHARRGGDSRASADLHRGLARPDHPGAQARGVAQRRLHAGRD